MCRAPREADLTDRISARAHLQIGLITVALCGFLYWSSGPETAFKSVLFYLPMWAGAEFVHWARMREATICQVCGFDPVLYQKNPLEARRIVEERLNRVVTDLKGQLKGRSPVSVKAPAAADPTKTAAAAPAADGAQAKNPRTL